MDDCNDDNYNNGLVESSKPIIRKKKVKSRREDHRSSHSLLTTSGTIRKNAESLPHVARSTATNDLKKTGHSQDCLNNGNTNISSTEPYCYVKLDSFIRLKDSTKKLLCLLEEIQSKTHSKHSALDWLKIKTPDGTNPIPTIDIINSVTDVCTTELKKLETQTKIFRRSQDEDDDCSIYKRLTRKCNCLNRQEYNDFVIQFNEEQQYLTSPTGELIKNLRILKKFLYIGGDYSKHALMFLIEGLDDSAYAEKVEIIQGCAHADMCNVFENLSLVITSIAWPYKYESFGDTVTQELAASFLYKLTQVEEGRRYLKYTTKLPNDIKKVLRKKRTMMNYKTVESLEATLDAMHLHNMNENNKIVYCMPSDEGYGSQTLKILEYYKHYMTMEEILTHLDLLNKFSAEERGKKELIMCLRPLVILFQEMLMTYNNSEMNIIITNILNNIVSKKFFIQESSTMPKIMTVANMATEPIPMKSQDNQIPEIAKKMYTKKNSNMSKSHLRITSSKGPSKAKNHNYFAKRSIIIVPIEE